MENKHLPADAVNNQCWPKCNICTVDRFNELDKRKVEWKFFDKVLEGFKNSLFQVRSFNFKFWDLLEFHDEFHELWEPVQNLQNG